MARVSRPATSNKIHVHVVTIHDPNWDAFAHAAHASQLGSCNYKLYSYTMYMYLQCWQSNWNCSSRVAVAEGQHVSC